MIQLQEIERTTGLLGNDAKGYQSVLNVFQKNTGATDAEMINWNQAVVGYANEQKISLVAAACVFLTGIEQAMEQ